MASDIVARCMKCEFIIVVGAEDLYFGPQRHNKMMFAQSAVRYTKKYRPRFDRTTVFYFKGKCENIIETPQGTYFADGYTNGQIAAMKSSIGMYGGVCKEAKTWGDIASHINNVEDRIDGCEKRVQVLVFFSHGVESKIWLSAQQGEFLEAEDLSAVSSNGFLPETFVSGRKYNERHVTSWACQTANSGDASLSVEDNMSKSLAQKMANAWDINVRASATRTIYTNVFSGGVSGLLDDWFGDRRLVDGVLWEDDGADGRVTSHIRGSTSNIKQGMWVFEPGQESGYKSGRFD